LVQIGTDSRDKYLSKKGLSEIGAAFSFTQKDKPANNAKMETFF
jgi:hypothetical protein